MTTSQRISAIITAYNSALFLSDAIESVLNQSHPVDEILVVDDGSNDETSAIAAKYADKGVRYIYQDNQGPGSARNLGLKNTRGELVAFLDADDIWLENKISQQIDYMETHPDVGVVSGQKIWWKITEGDSKWIEHFGISHSRLKREIVVKNVVGNPSMALIRRSVIEEAGNYNQNLRWGQDWEIWIRMSNYTQFGFLKDPIIIYRAHSDNITYKTPIKRLDCLLNISKVAIQNYKPAWRRPLLLAHAISNNYYYRAKNANKESLPYLTQLKYSFFALILYPWDDFSIKSRLLFRIIIRKKLYELLSKTIRHKDDASEV